MVCSPTGSGKTVIFELAIIRLLMNSVHERAQNFKIIYSKTHEKDSSFVLSCIVDKGIVCEDRLGYVNTNGVFGF